MNRIDKRIVFLAIIVIFGIGFSTPPSFLDADRHPGAGLRASFTPGRSLPPRRPASFETNATAGVPVSRDTARPPSADDWLDTLIEKIWLQESSGRLHPPNGDGGKAAGPLQLHPGAVMDVNHYYGTNFTLDDRHDIGKAKQIARLYMQLWMDRHKTEIAARIFNGGPRGWEKKSTKKYWEKISRSRDNNDG